MKVFANVALRGAAMIAALLLSGCFIQSVHPYYLKETVVNRPELEGEWRLMGEGEGPETIFAFEEGELVVSGESEEKFESTFFEIEGTLLLDLYPSEGGSAYFNMHVYPTHGLTIVEYEGDLLRLIPLDEGDFHEGLEEGRIDLPYVKAEETWALVTASSDEWEAFLRDYLKRPGVLDRENALLLKRKS